jgi:hypothetical protein
MGINRGYSIRKIRMMNRSFHPLAKLDRTGGPAALSFPEDKTYLEHHIVFRIFDTRRDSRDSADKIKALATITLPMTQELQVSYNAGYASPDIGGILAEGTKMVENIGGAIAEKFDDNKKVAMTSAAQKSFGLQSFLEGISGAAINTVGQGLEAAGLGVPVKVGLSAFGVARNPHKATLFEGTDFRSHNFNFKLSPITATESTTIRQIIHLFKYHMHPGYAEVSAGGQNVSAGNHFFSTPDFFRIELAHGKYTVNDYRPCVLKGMTVNYQPSNYPAYARSNGQDPAPMEVVMGLEFQEIEIITKKIIGDPYLSANEVKPYRLGLSD